MESRKLTEADKVTTKQVLLIILAGVFALFLSLQIIASNNGKPWIHPQPISVKKTEKMVEKARIDNYGIVNHGNGVYFFPDNFRRGDRFGITLSAFIEEHPELELVSVTAESKNGVFGYIVVFRPKR